MIRLRSHDGFYWACVLGLCFEIPRAYCAGFIASFVQAMILGSRGLTDIVSATYMFLDNLDIGIVYMYFRVSLGLTCDSATSDSLDLPFPTEPPQNR